MFSAQKEVLHLSDYHRKQSGGKISLNSGKSFRVLAHDAATLSEVVEEGSVDYIFTDPPYGAFISYLDLSTLWNHWLGFPVTEGDRTNETIVGGNRNLTEQHYKSSLAESIRSCLRLLRPDRWFSIVFQHWDVSYFATILETATDCGAELKAAITQTGDVIWSMHKKKNSASVLAGEMILTFYKPLKARKKRTGSPMNEKGDTAAVLSEILDACLDNGTRSFTSEAMFNRLVIEMWHRRALSCLSMDRRDFAAALRNRGWNYNARVHLWSLGQGSAETSGQDTLFDVR